MIPEVVAVGTAAEEVEITAPVAGGSEGALHNAEAPVAPEIITGVHVDLLPGSSTDVVVRSPVIQDAEPIHSVPMAEAMSASRDRLELLADHLVDPMTVACNLKVMRCTEQWIKVCCSTLSNRVLSVAEYSILIVALCRMSWRDPDKNQI
jgi:hypothetical protein